MGNFVTFKKGNMNIDRLFKNCFVYDLDNDVTSLRVSAGTSETPLATEAKQAELIALLGGASSSEGAGTIQYRSLTQDVEDFFLPTEYGTTAQRANITIAGDDPTDYVEYVANGIWANDGTEPRGHRVFSGGAITLTSRFEVENFKVIAKSVGVELIAEFSSS